MTSLPVDYEQIVQETYESFLQPGDIVIDVGAHQGRHTLPLANCVGPSGKVIAVEPLAECRRALWQQLERRPCAFELSPCALSDRAGTEPFIVAEGNLPFSGLRRVPYPSSTVTSEFMVVVETIDRLFYDLPRLDYIKIDAEGAELNILRGGAATIEKFRPVVGFEFGAVSNREYNVQPEDIPAFWLEHGYQLFAITGIHLDRASFVHHANERAIWDYVAVPDEQEELQDTLSDALNRPRINWLAVRAELNHAQDHIDVGKFVPPLRRFRGPMWPLARFFAWLFLLPARMITGPQRLYNRSLLLGLQQLIDDLEKADRERQQHWRRFRHMERSVQQLEERLRELKQESHRIRNPSEATLS